MGQFNIKALRVINGVSVEEMADYLGISRQTYSKKESGISEFTGTELFKIFDKFNVTDITSIKL